MSKEPTRPSKAAREGGRGHGEGETRAAPTEERRAFSSSTGACPYALEPRIDRLKRELDALLLKIEGLALLGDILERKLAHAATAQTPCHPRGTSCEAEACQFRKRAEELEQAFDQIAGRIKALNQAVDNARRLKPPPRGSGPRRLEE